MQVKSPPGKSGKGKNEKINTENQYRDLTNACSAIYFILMKITRKEQHLIARLFLQEELDFLRPGEALPGIRTLCLRSGINFHILNSELQQMVRQGLVFAVPRRGMFKRREEKKQTIWLFHERDSRNLGAGFIRELHEELRTICRKNGFELKSCQIDESFLPKYRAFCRKHRVKMAFCEGFSHSWFMNLIQAECPHCISLLPHYTVNSGFALIDSPDMTAIQLEHLFHLGYRKIGYIHNVVKPVERSFVQQARLSEYYRIMAENGLPVKKEWVFPGYCTENIFADRLSLLMKSGAQAVIVAGSFVRLLYETLQKQLYVPGDDLGIFCCDEIDGLPDPVPTTVTNSPRSIISSAWQLLQESLNGCPARIECSQLRIITGNTLNFCGTASVENE